MQGARAPTVASTEFSKQGAQGLECVGEDADEIDPPGFEDPPPPKISVVGGLARGEVKGWAGEEVLVGREEVTEGARGGARGRITSK